MQVLARANGSKFTFDDSLRLTNVSTSPQSSIHKLSKHLNNVKQRSTQTVYRDESVYDFDTPESKPYGLFVCLKTFNGVSKKFLGLHHKITKNCVYLQIKRTRIENGIETTEERPERSASPPRKRTKSTPATKSQFNEKLKIVFLDGKKAECYALTDPHLPEEIRQSVRSLLAADSDEEPSAKSEAKSPAVSGNQRICLQRPVTRFDDLQQLDNGVQVPPEGWICSKCPKRDGLWMNLTDGTIACSRGYYDGSGGNGHAVEHYLETGYPLVVKLSTITSHGADVYSYPEDQMVNDPKLREHLAHFGIHVAEDKEKTITLDDDSVTTLDAGGNLKLLFGPGYVGMENLGNSCYLNCVMQVLFSTPEFQETYYPPNALPGHPIYAGAPDPPQDFDFQMAKLAHGLLSPYYSLQPAYDQPAQSNSIRPTSFKQLMGKNHPEFAAKKQQDADEFFRLILDLIEKSTKDPHKKNVLPDLSIGFKFKIEEKTTYMKSKKINYAHHTDYVLSLPIALDKAFDRVRVQGHPNEVPRVMLTDCLEKFASESIISGFTSPETNVRTRAKRRYRLETFPDYLMVQMQKFASNGDGPPKKIHCSLDVPLVLDLTWLRAKGPQPGEQLMADSIRPKPKFSEPPEPVKLNDELVGELLDFEFPLEACKRALIKTKTDDVNTALDWLFEHQNDDDFDLPIEIELEMWKTIDEQRKKIDEQRKIKETGFRDGYEVYQLVAFITHMGESAQSGHYVCHIWKEDRWVLYNDNMVVESENPPIDLAYMYLYRRIVVD